METKVALLVVSIIGFASAGQKCTGNPRMYQGKRCASTTRYADYHKGACGCGPDNNDNQYDWNHSGFNTAPNQLFFDAGGKGWCGQNCGKCVKLTPTGGWIDGQGGSSRDLTPRVFMVTNLCPNEFPNLSWCSQTNNNNNQYGYGWHFDLENGVSQINGLGWNNPEVTWEFVDCDFAHNQDGRTPSNGFASAGQKCTGSPRMYQGKNCASTTRYADYHKGACGCGPDNSDNQYDWNHSGFNTAPNQLFFDAGGKSWCGQNCGKCVKLTPTGGWIDGQGGPSRDQTPRVFMVTNLCPNEFPNLSWCSQTRNNNNQYGYGWHFDLENGVSQISGLGWNNPEVTWEFIDCDSAGDGRTPSNQKFHECFCGRNGKRSINQTDFQVV